MTKLKTRLKAAELEEALFEALMVLKHLYYHDALDMYRRKDLPVKFKPENIKEAESLFRKYDVSF